MVILILPPTQRLEDRTKRPLAVDAREEFASPAREGAVLASDDVLPGDGGRVRHQGVWRAGGRLRGWGRIVGLFGYRWESLVVGWRLHVCVWDVYVHVR